MKIAVFGPGYVGLVAAACLASLGNDIICVGRDKKKIDNLKVGIVPIFEPGLSELIKINSKEERLNFTTDSKFAIENSEVIFIAVGTPQGDDGQAFLGYVLEVAKSIGEHMNGYKVIVDKSTVPVGTADKVKEVIKANLKNKDQKFDVVSNPEFLREGEAISDFMVPDRVVIGVDSQKAKEVMTLVYQGIERTGRPILVTDVKSAELIKYASNAMLATRISFMNQLSPLCEKIGADIKLVAKGMGLDDRIGPRFLQAGVGYGGSCFPKDVQAIIHTLKEHGCSAEILDAVEAVNKKQKRNIVEKIKTEMKDLKGKKFAVWGLAFKPKTDDMREAPSIVIINELQKMGATIAAFDPVAEETAQKELNDITYVKTPYDALKDADALVICTEWDEFRSPDFSKIKKLMKANLIFDGRNVYDPLEMKKLGFKYYSIGRKAVV